MKTLRLNVEVALTAYVMFCYRHPKSSLIVALTITALLSVGMASLKVDASTQSYLNQNDSALAQYFSSRDAFGSDDSILITLKPAQLFSDSFLAELKGLHAELESVTYGLKVESLVNSTYSYGKDDELDISELVNDHEGSNEALKHKALSTKAYENNLISSAGTETTIIVKLKNKIPDENGKLVYLSSKDAAVPLQEVTDIVTKTVQDRYPFYITGTAAATLGMTSSVEKSLGVLSSLSMLSIIVILYILFRRVSGVALPLFVVICSFVAMFGSIELLGFTVLATSQILPSLVITFGACDSIHLLSVFYKQLQQENDKASSLEEATTKTGFALLMTTITTAAGLFSFVFSDMPPILFLGLFGAIGVMFALFFTLTLIPSMIAILPLKQVSIGQAVEQNSSLDNALLRLAGISGRYRFLIMFATLMLVFPAGYYISQLKLSHDPISWFALDHKLRSDITAAEDYFNGQMSVDFIIDTGSEGGVNNSELLQALDDFISQAPSIEYNGISFHHASSVVEIVKETNKALFNNDQAAYAVPTDNQLLSQEMLLFETGAADNLRDFVDSNFRVTRVIFYTKFHDLTDIYGLSEKVKRQLTDKLDPQISVTSTGIGYLTGKAFELTLPSLLQSYGAALIIITICIIVIIQDVRLGLLSMIPNLIPIVFAMGIMAAFDIKLDVFTMLIGSMMLGIVVDDTIHFLMDLKRNLKEGMPPHSAIDKTIVTTGRQILFTSLVIGAGFLAYLASELSNVRAFGLLTACTCFFAFMADVLLLPAILKTLMPIEKPVKKVSEQYSSTLASPIS